MHLLQFFLFYNTTKTWFLHWSYLKNIFSKFTIFSNVCKYIKMHVHLLNRQFCSLLCFIFNFSHKLNRMLLLLCNDNNLLLLLWMHKIEVSGAELKGLGVDDGWEVEWFNVRSIVNSKALGWISEHIFRSSFNSAAAAFYYVCCILWNKIDVTMCSSFLDIYVLAVSIWLTSMQGQNAMKWLKWKLLMCSTLYNISSSLLHFME